MIGEIFLDMDGVLSDFKGRYVEVFKSDPEEDYETKDKKKKKLYKGKFKDFVNSGEFENLAPMPDMYIGLEYIKSLNLPTSILTSTACEEYIHILGKHKKNWLTKYNIPYNIVLVPGKRLKHFYSKPGRILIDDTLSNVENWISMGGIGIKHVNWVDTIEEMKKYTPSALGV